MVKDLMYMNKINNMDDKRIPKKNLNSIHYYQHLKQRWHQDDVLVKSLGNIAGCHPTHTDNIKNIIVSKFKEDLWCNEELDIKRKPRYYEGVTRILKDQKYLLVLTSIKKKSTLLKQEPTPMNYITTMVIGKIPKTVGCKNLSPL